MNTIIVTCAGCGKRFKGSPGPKKFKCSDCSNLFMFPDAPCTPSEGHTYCTLCWTELGQDAGLEDCPNCRQKIKTGIAGKAVLAGSGSILPQINAPVTSTRLPAVDKPPDLHQQLIAAYHERDALLQTKKENEKTKTVLLQRLAFAEAQAQAKASQPAEETGGSQWELQMEVGELKTQLSKLQADLAEAERGRDEALAFAEAKAAELEALGGSGEKPAAAGGNVAELEDQIAKLTRERDEAVEGMSQAQFNLDRFREAAVAAIEPLGQEYSRQMRELMTETESMLNQLRQMHQESYQRMDEKLNIVAESLKERMKNVRRDMAIRMAEVLGTPPEQSMQQMPEVDDQTPTKTAADPAA
jgi:hypothetical protein